MANKHKGEVECHIGGKDRILKFSMNSFVEVEEILDKPIHKIVHEDKMGIRELRALLYVGIKWDNKHQTLEQVGDLITRGNLQGLSVAVGNAIALAIGDDPGVEGDGGCEIGVDDQKN